MSFTSPSTNNVIEASHITQFVNAWTGASGGGEPFQCIQVNDASNYAVDVRNLHSTNSYGLRVRDASGNVLIQASKNTLQLGANAANDTLTINASLQGTVYINDSANANMTVGLTINQGTNDDEVLAFKRSDVAHGITTLTETDTYGLAQSMGAGGGLQIRAFGSQDSYTMMLLGVALADVTTKTTLGLGTVCLNAYKKSGTTGGAPGADANLVVIQAADTTRFIFDAEGSAHADVEWTTYDSHDDLALLNKLDAAMTRDPVKTEFGAYLDDYRQELQDARIVNFYSPDGPRAMVNFTRLQMLTVGALRQLGQRIATVEQKLLAEGA